VAWGSLMNLRELLNFNLFLQVFDGTATYFILSKGESELIPLVNSAIDTWGLFWALLYWKILLCGSLLLLYSFRRFQPSLPQKGLTITAIFYSMLGVNLVYHLLQSAG